MLMVACMIIIVIVGIVSLTKRSFAASVDFSNVPGVVIDHIPADFQRYIGSPSIAVLPSGDYIASHDIFGPGSTFSECAETKIFRSSDLGNTWEHISTIKGQAWSSLFCHGDALYILGTDRNYGQVVIRRSVDGGSTWTDPREEGILIEGKGYHCAPVPVIIHEGRIWRAFEKMEDGEKKAFIMSAPVDCDLLKAENWKSSRLLSNGLGGTQWLEGNVVVDPNGQLVNILRINAGPLYPQGGKAAITHVTDGGAALLFDAEKDIIDFPGGSKKFTIRYDTSSRLYWTLSNPVLKGHADGDALRTRNAVALMASSNLCDWSIRSIVLYHPDVSKHAFQYLDWLFEGNDMIAVSRTAYDDGLGGAANQHDANFMTFHRIKNFRSLTLAEGRITDV